MSFLRRCQRLPGQIGATQLRVSPQNTPFLSQRRRVGGYGDGEGDPKGSTPQSQGSNPSEHLEHPGPPPVSEGRGSGGGPTKGSSEGSESSTSSKDANDKPSSSSKGAQPKIHDERDGPPMNSKEDVDQHNREFEQRHDRASEKSDKQKVDKKFWSGHGGVEN